MGNVDHDKQEQLEKHSLPGTNQAGKGARPSEKRDDDEPEPGSKAEQDQDQLEAHSLPGTNQAGKPR
jgi:hypothetical protein